jgi:gliding motility-associated-like protein
MLARRIFFVAAFFFTGFISFSQNLVPNPSFETFTACPVGNSQISQSVPWDRPPGSITTPDYFNSCNAGVGCANVSVPTNFAGTVNAFQGVAYAGIITYYTGCPNCREYITAPFNTPLVANTQYCVSFRVCRGSESRYATNNMGAYISIGAPNQPSNQPILLIPQVEYLGVITDSANWTLVSGLYTAIGGETHITIGNFHNNAQNTIFDYGPVPSPCALANAAAFYYIDSVFVGTCAVLPVANFTASNTNICVGDCINFTDQTTNNPVSWNWTFPGGNPPSSVSQNPNNICFNTAGTYTVVLTASNANGTDSASLTIIVNPPPVAQINGTQTVCLGQSANLTASPNSSTYLWNTGATTQSINPTPTVNTTFTVTVTSGSCSDTATFAVTVHPLPTVTTTANTSICQGALPVQLNTTGGLTYTWSPATGLSCTNCANPTANPAATTTYTVTGTDLNGCVDTAIVTITVNPLPVITSSANPAVVCSGQPVTLTGTGGSTYVWSPGNSTGTSITVTPTANTTYTVVGTDANGCTNSSTVTVTVNFPPTATASPDVTICEGNSATLTAGGGGTYLWSSGSTTSTITVSPTVTTQYSVVVTNNCGSDTAYTTVNVNPLPNANAGSSVTIYQGQSTQLGASGGGTYQWIPPTDLSCTNCPNPVASPMQTTTYCVIVTSSGNCVDSSCMTVFVEPLICGEVFVPSGFSPNNDGMNDILYVRGNCITKMLFRVYNRWGEKVYEGTDPTKGWEGTLDGKPLNAAVFVYDLEATLIDGQVVKMKGNVSLVK